MSNLPVLHRQWSSETHPSCPPYQRFPSQQRFYLSACAEEHPPSPKTFSDQSEFVGFEKDTAGLPSGCQGWESHLE